MGQWREITAGSDGTLLWNHRQDAAVVQLAEQLNDFETDPAQPKREHVRTQQNHRAHFRLRKRIADSAGMTAHQVELELTKLARGNMDVGKLTEARVDAINHRPLLHDFI